jgi:hypothetical protein
VRGKTNTALIGLMLGPALWLVIVALALAVGIEDRLFDLALIAGHARLLVIIPLFFACEALARLRLRPTRGMHVRLRLARAVSLCPASGGARKLDSIAWNSGGQVF